MHRWTENCNVTVFAPPWQWSCRPTVAECRHLPSLPPEQLPNQTRHLPSWRNTYMTDIDYCYHFAKLSTPVMASISCHKCSCCYLFWDVDKVHRCALRANPNTVNPWIEAELWIQAKSQIQYRSSSLVRVILEDTTEGWPLHAWDKPHGIMRNWALTSDTTEDYWV